MSKVLVTESYLTDIGNAIRSKNGSTSQYKPSEMAGAINDITTQDNTVLNSILDRSISGDYVNADCTKIGYCAFQQCKNLTSATFTKVTEIDFRGLSYCSSLESISLPEVKQISAGAFDSCALKSISMPKVEKLGAVNDLWGIFTGCPMTTINIPSTIQYISEKAFDSSKITTINIDKPVNSISGAPWGATGAGVYWQGKLAQYTEVDLNGGQWVDSGTQVDGHTVYKSDAGSYHTNYGKSICTVTVCGYSKVTVYATNYSESGYDYTEVGPLDGEVARGSTTNALSTRFQNSKTDYKSYTFNLPDTNVHTFQILYSKDSGKDENDDRGYFYLTAE